MNIVRSLKIKLNSWFIPTVIISVLLLIPYTNIIKVLFLPVNDNWVHIKEYLLENYIFNSLYLVIFTGMITAVIGSCIAWIMVAYEFPLKRFLKWALILPLAIPPYIGAYTYSNMLSYTGVVQTFLRNKLQLEINPELFDIMSVNGGVFIFTAFLYPYVYVITKSFLEKQASSYLEVSKMYGRKGYQIFLEVILPLSKAAIIGGVIIVALEVLSDYGVVNYFGIQTFSVAIFKTWFGMSDIDSATRLAVIFLIIISAILMVERFFTNSKKLSIISTKHKRIKPILMSSLAGKIVTSIFLIIFSIAFLIPFIQMLVWSLDTYKDVLDFTFLELVFNSVVVSGISSILIIVTALIVANQCRFENRVLSKIFARITTLGYVIPGAVVAIIVLSSVIFIDKLLASTYQKYFSISGGLLLTTSVFTLIIAYVMRYLSVGFNTIESGFNKIGVKYHEASRLLGVGMTKTFFRVDFKLIRPVILSAFILLFIDVSKELPLTLILRPFNFDTLATKTYEYANDEMIQEAAIPSMLIVLISSLGVYLLNRISERKD